METASRRWGPHSIFSRRRSRDGRSEAGARGGVDGPRGGRVVSVPAALPRAYVRAAASPHRRAQYRSRRRRRHRIGGAESAVVRGARRCDRALGGHDRRGPRPSGWRRPADPLDPRDRRDRSAGAALWAHHVRAEPALDGSRRGHAPLRVGTGARRRARRAGPRLGISAGVACEAHGDHPALLAAPAEALLRGPLWRAPDPWAVRTARLSADVSRAVRSVGRGLHPRAPEHQHALARHARPAH